MEIPTVDQLVGQRFGQYRMERLLGRNRLSAVYLAQHPSYHTSVAVTTYSIPEHISVEARTRFMQRFNKEAALLTRLDHPHVMPVYEHGEQYGYPYLVTPYMMQGSLADEVKQQGRCTQEYTLEILQQVASGLDYAHKNQVVHGTLKPSNVVYTSEGTVLVAGFGLMRILQMRGVERSGLPYAHLLSIANTFLVSPEYVAPEVVQGQPVDARADIYALGIILFEMLSGQPPFTGSSPLDVAQQHIQQSLPSLRALAPKVPIALESIIYHALSRNPAQRFQHVSELAEAFSQVCPTGASPRSTHFVLADSEKRLAASSTYMLQETPRSGLLSINWQLTPPIVTGKLSSLQPSPRTEELAPQATAAAVDSWQILPPIVTGRLSTVKAPEQKIGAVVTSQATQDGPTSPLDAPLSSVQQDLPQQASVSMSRSVASVGGGAEAKKDNGVTSAWQWHAPESFEDASLPEPGSFKRAKKSTMRAPASKRPRNAGRRRVVALLATGGIVVAAGGVAAMKTHLVPHLGTTSVQQSKQNTNDAATTTSTKQSANGAPSSNHMHTGPSTTPVNKTQGNTPPAHTGTVIGSTMTLAPNTSVNFMNPVDGKASLLVHLPGGNFVAYEKACTHEQVPVYYDAGTHKLVCPAHGSIFDPARGAKVLQGPAQTPLALVAIHVNADGTITV